MQFEDFDKKIKEAADHHHPAYDEQAWTKMEKLLNKHLPEKEDDRRRFLFIILLFLGLGGGALFITKPWKKAGQETIAATQPVKTNELSEPAPGNPKETEPRSDNNMIVPADDDYLMPATGDNDKTGPGINHENAPAPSIRNNGVPAKNTMDPQTKGGEQVTLKNTTRKLSIPVTVNTKTTSNKPLVHKNETKQEQELKKDPPGKSDKDVVPVTTLDVALDAAIGEKKKAEDIKTDVPVLKTDERVADKIDPKKDAPLVNADPKKEEPVMAKATEKKTNKKKKQSSFFLSLSAGPDMSFVNHNKAGNVKLLTGVGLGYNFKDRLTFRTGFYAARKVYTANPDAYNPPPGFYSLYPYLEKVDADCKVYEIPVALSYNFGKGTSRNWFVSAGLSTFLMNKETYNYHYKYTPLGNSYTNKWTIKNKNSHFFSVATLSAGYRKAVNNRITVMAEPYFKLPLGGVGYGKVKLNSGGALFTVGIRLF